MNAHSAPIDHPALGRANPAPAPAPPVRRLPVGLIVSFLMMVVAPLAFAALYLSFWAEDQFESVAALSVRQEEARSPVDLFGGFAGLSGSSSSDTDILYAYLTSPELVAKVDADLNLRDIFGRVHGRDPVFGFDPAGTIEDLTRYWGWMVAISHDAGTGLIEMRVRAFDPNEARAIAEAAFAHGSTMINGLSAAAREDALRFAREDLTLAEARLRAAREALTAYRARTQIVDPSADVSGQMGLLGTLQEQLAEELIRSDLLAQQTHSDDPRLARSAQRIDVIEARIAQERQKLGGSGGNGGGAADYAGALAEFERLSVEVEFSQQAYIAARTAFELARTEATRQSRYLAAHVRPTLAERATAPDPLVVLGVLGLFACLIWGAAMLVIASLRDRA